MPKTENTRKQRATELVNRLKCGPSGAFDTNDITGQLQTTERRKALYKMWFESWVEHELFALIPELRNQQ